MSGLTYRDTKLSELTHDEVDENFRYLEQKANLYEVGQVYRGPVQKIYNGQLYLLSPGVTFPFTAANFVTELAAGNWQLVGSGTSYKGELNLTTPVLVNGTGTIGDYYKVVQDGDYDFGAGEVHYNNGDFVLYDGAVYGPYVDNNQLFSSLFNKKEFDKIHQFTATGTNVVIPFHLYGYSTIELSGALTSISGFSFTDLIANPAVAEYPHDGKSMFIINRSGHDITLKNADFASLAVVFFAFDGGNIVIPNDGKLEIKYKADSLIDILKSWTTTDDVIGLQAELDLKLNIADYNDRFKGKYTSLVNLQAAHPTSNDGDTAVVDAGPGTNAIEYIWDANEGWVQGNSVGATTTDALPEGSTNLYHTAARVLATVLSGLSSSSGTFSSSDSVLTAFGKIKYLIDNIATTYQAILVSGTNIKTINGTSILGSGDLVVSGSDYIKHKVKWKTFRSTVVNTWKAPTHDFFDYDTSIFGNFGTGTTPTDGTSGLYFSWDSVPTGYLIDSIVLEVNLRNGAGNLQVYIDRAEAATGQLSNSSATNIINLVNQVVPVAAGSDRCKFIFPLTVASHSVPTLAQSFTKISVRETTNADIYYSLNFDIIYKKI